MGVVKDTYKAMYKKGPNQYGQITVKALVGVAATSGILYELTSSGVGFVAQKLSTIDLLGKYVVAAAQTEATTGNYAEFIIEGPVLGAYVGTAGITMTAGNGFTVSGTSGTIADASDTLASTVANMPGYTISTSTISTYQVNIMLLGRPFMNSS